MDNFLRQDLGVRFTAMQRTRPARRAEIVTLTGPLTPEMQHFMDITTDMSEFTNDYNDWICGICQEGDANYGARTRHACGHHEFHTRCLEDMQIRDIRCAICRYPPNAASPVFSQTTQHSSTPDRSTPEIPARPLQMTRSNAMNPSMARALSRFPGYMRQVMPSNLRLNRIHPMVGRGLGRDICCYCNQPIEEVLHGFLRSCFHHIHSLCVIETLYQNGCDADTGNLFCPVCHERCALP